MQNRQRSLIPCTALGCMELLTRSEINLRGKEAVLMGDSNVVGTPLAMLLRDSGVAALTLCRSAEAPLPPVFACPRAAVPATCIEGSKIMPCTAAGGPCKRCSTTASRASAGLRPRRACPGCRAPYLRQRLSPARQYRAGPSSQRTRRRTRWRRGAWTGRMTRCSKGTRTHPGALSPSTCPPLPGARPDPDKQAMGSFWAQVECEQSKIETL